MNCWHVWHAFPMVDIAERPFVALSCQKCTAAMEADYAKDGSII